MNTPTSPRTRASIEVPDRCMPTIITGGFCANLSEGFEPGGGKRKTAVRISVWRINDRKPGRGNLCLLPVILFGKRSKTDCMLLVPILVIDG